VTTLFGSARWREASQTEDRVAGRLARIAQP
jgi:hypothetical protein